MRKSIPALSLAIIASLRAGAPAQAQDAEFGCKVLLCAAATNPSWPSIPYCVPVMNQLQAMMRSLRFRWPVCTAAGTGAPGFDPFEPCPPGWQETRDQTQSSSRDGGGDSGASNDVSSAVNHLCARRVPSQVSGRRPEASMPGGQIQCFGLGSDTGAVVGSGQECVEFRPRPRKERPYYLDLRSTDGNPTRIWFNVR